MKIWPFFTASLILTTAVWAVEKTSSRIILRQPYAGAVQSTYAGQAVWEISSYSLPLAKIDSAVVSEPKTPQIARTLPVTRTLPITKGPSLPPVATPVNEAAALEEVLFEDIAPAAGIGMIYQPGTLVSFTLPTGFVMDKGRLRRTSAQHVSDTLARRLTFARAVGAVEDARLRAESVVEGRLAPVAQAKIVDEPTSQSVHEQTSVVVVSVTHGVSDSAMHLAHQEEDVPGLFPERGTPKMYWPALLSHLSTINKAQVEAGVMMAQAPQTEDSAEEKAAAAIEPHAGPSAEGEHGGTTEAEPGLMVKEEVVGEVNPAWTKSPDDVNGHPRVVGARRNLATFYAAWERYPEAISELIRQPKREDGLPRHAEDRFLLAIAHVMNGDGAEALSLLNMDASFKPDERALWKATALHQLGRSAEALHVWPDKQGILPRYPAAMRRHVLLNRAEALVAVGNRNDALAFTDEVANEYPPGEVPSALTRLQGVVRIGTNQEQKGLELLAQAADDTRDPATAFHAKYDFVNALLSRRELEDRQVTAYLEELRLYWRGDELERQTLNQLGEYYLRQHDYRRALGRWKTSVRAFPNQAGIASLTEKMTNAVVGAFDPENPERYDAITFLGLYFDFKELLPNDERGDRAMERAGQMLTRTSLAPRAIPVLEQVLQYRVKEPIDKVRVALLLADAYTANGKPDMAIKTLDAHRSLLVNTTQLRQWPLVEARALMALDKPDDALAVLKDNTDAEAIQITSDAAWVKQDWLLLEKTLAPVVARLKMDKLKDDDAGQVAVLRLAYALGQQGKRVDLENVLDKIGAEGKSLPTMADSLAAISTQAGVARAEDAVRPLAQVAGALAGLNDFTDRFKSSQADAAKRAQEREEYNNKMRYNDLLPPPAI